MLTIFISLAIALVTYSWGLYMQRREKSQLMEFLERFESSSCVLEDTDIPFDESMSKPLLLLAKAFENSGEYHKTIGIYLYLIKSGKNDELLEQLAKVYLRAGFLERAESIFLQVLSRHPRNISALYQLGVVYELLRSYKKAIETLEPLEILGEDTKVLRSFWEFEKLQQDETILENEKIILLIKMIRDKPKLYRLVIAALFRLSNKTGWEQLQLNRLKESLDLLWYLPSSQLDFDIIESSDELKKIYFARGDVQHIEKGALEKQSTIVSIDILSAARYAGEDRGNISFSYLCDKCKQSFPIAFKRCHNCLAINSAQVEEYIAKDEEADYSLF